MTPGHSLLGQNGPQSFPPRIDWPPGLKWHCTLFLVMVVWYIVPTTNNYYIQVTTITRNSATFYHSIRELLLLWFYHWPVVNVLWSFLPLSLLASSINENLPILFRYYHCILLYYVFLPSFLHKMLLDLAPNWPVCTLGIAPQVNEYGNLASDWLACKLHVDSPIKSNMMWSNLIGPHSWLWGNNSRIGMTPDPSSLVKGLARQTRQAQPFYTGAL